MMKTKSWWSFRKGMGVLPVVAASMTLVATSMGASAAGVTLHATEHSHLAASHQLHGTVTKQATVKKFDPSATAFTLDATTTYVSCLNTKIAPTHTKLPKGKFSEYAAPLGASGDEGTVLRGTDDAVWYGSNSSDIVRASDDGHFTVCPIPTNTDYVDFLTNGPDGAVWFTEYDNDKIGRIQIVRTKKADDIVKFTEFSGGGIDGPEGIVGGPDHNLWITEYDGNRVDQMTVNGTGVAYSLPTADSEPAGITVGPDNALWFTEYGNATISRINLDGVIHEFTGTVSEPWGIVTGPDHNLWFTDSGNGSVGNMTTEGTVTEYGDLLVGASPDFITNLRDGKSLVFTEDNGVIARVTTDGKVTEIGIPNEQYIYGIVATGDNTVWFTQDDEATLGKFTFKS
ncbi:MAG TPA: hypothetical protein VFN23_11370 [Ktedonobacteraceae bacterium]|nr:hypothetical protein [Ktedonobacteraceae bacterium]